MLVAKDDFVGLPGIAHLASGGQPPLLKRQRQAFEKFATDKSTGMVGYEHHWQVCNDVKAQLGTLTGLKPESFALIGNASEGIARVVSSLDWAEGDNTVVSSLDYASGRYALHSLERLGVHTRSIDPEGWTIREKDLIAACDERTRLLYVSQVNSLTGQHLDLSLLSSELHRRNIALLVDTSHALGVVPVDGSLCDFMVSSTYKFLLSPHSGVLAWNSHRWPDFRPAAVGWNSADPGSGTEPYALAPDARRAEIGNSNHLAVYLLHAALEYLLAIDTNQLQRHIDQITEHISGGLTDLDVNVITPVPAGSRGPNVSFIVEEPRHFVDAAANEGILLWGDNGRVRASAHAFVTNDDVDRLLAFTSRWKART